MIIEDTESKTRLKATPIVLSGKKIIVPMSKKKAKINQPKTRLRLSNLFFILLFFNSNSLSFTSFIFVINLNLLSLNSEPNSLHTRPNGCTNRGKKITLFSWVW